MRSVVQVYIMSHNRPDFISDTLRSVISQEGVDFEVVVSENSSNNDIENLICKNFPDVKCVRRNPMLSMYEHWNQIISEVTAPYFMMFHDDDILLPGALKKLYDELEKDKSASAAAGNAYVIRLTTLTSEIFNKGIRKAKKISSANELGKQYFQPKNGVQPFPGYLYRTHLCKNVSVNSKEAGKHSDVTFLMKCLRFGPIIWITAPTLQYRYHTSNSSVGFEIVPLFNLTKFYCREAKLPKSEYHVQEFKVKNYMLWMREYGFWKLKQLYPNRHKIILKFITFFFITHPIGLLRIIFRKSLPKFS